MDHTFHLCKLVANALKTTTVYALEKAINEANSADGSPARITRHILKALLENSPKVALTLQHFHALDVYFTGKGILLTEEPIFEKRGLLEWIAGPPEVRFFFAAKPNNEERHDDLSLWDLKSITCLMKDIYEAGKSLQKQTEFRLVDVLLNEKITAAEYKNEAWHAEMLQENSVLIAIGSPRVSLASEFMLSEMFGLKPFDKQGGDGPQPLPFHFLWSAKVKQSIPSHFSLKVDDIKRLHPELALRVARNKAWAVFLNNRVFETKLQEKKFEMIGVIVAQRREKDQVWVVVSGISGPATFGAAQMVRQIQDQIPHQNDPGNPILWVPVRVEVETASQRKSGDARAVKKAEIFGEPQIWTRY